MSCHDRFCLPSVYIRLSVTTDLKKTGSSICRSEMKSLVTILVGPIQYNEISLGTAFFMIVGMLWMLSTRLNNRAAIFVFNMISLAAILGGQTQAQAIGFNIWIQRQQHARSSFYFEISVCNGPLLNSFYHLWFMQLCLPSILLCIMFNRIR